MPPAKLGRFGPLVRLGLGLLIGAAALGWAAAGVDWTQVLHHIASASPAWLVLSVLGVIGVAAAKTRRWQALYSGQQFRLRFHELFSVLMAAQTVNLLIPIRVGDLVRIGLMKQSGQSGTVTASTIIIEKTVDLIVAGLLAMALVVLQVGPGWLAQPAGVLLGWGLALGAGLFVMWRGRAALTRLVAAILASGWLPLTWQERLLRVIRLLLSTPGSLARWTAVRHLVFWTGAIWMLSLLTIVALLVAFDLTVPVTAAVIIMLAISFSNIAPSPPALVGLMPGITVVVLSQYHVSQASALGCGLVLNVITVGPVVILGCWALLSRLESFYGSIVRRSDESSISRCNLL